MQEPKQEMTLKRTEIEREAVEQEDDEVRRSSSPWLYVFWAAVILCIVGFTVFGVTTLMHIPPTIEKDTGFISAYLL